MEKQAARGFLTLGEKVNPKQTAVVVIDMQNDFCHEDGRSGQRGFDVKPSQDIVEPIRLLLAEARKVGTRVIFVRVILNEHNISRNSPNHWPDEDGSFICKEGTWGADWYELVPEDGDIVLTKPRYSAFIGTNFDQLLRVNGIDTLVLAGTRTNVCVESTARDGFMMDYYVVVLSDCTSANSPEEHERGLLGSFGDKATAGEVIAEWHKLAQADNTPLSPMITT